MPGPVERWLETFMCKQYAEAFEAYGYKTLQSVCQLQLPQLQAMGVIPEHCEKILENVSVLRQTLMAKNLVNTRTFTHTVDPVVNPASSALASVARNANAQKGMNPYMEDTGPSYGPTSSSSMMNMGFPQQSSAQMGNMQPHPMSSFQGGGGPCYPGQGQGPSPMFQQQTNASPYGNIGNPYMQQQHGQPSGHPQHMAQQQQPPQVQMPGQYHEHGYGPHGGPHGGPHSGGPPMPYSTYSGNQCMDTPSTQAGQMGNSGMYGGAMSGGGGPPIHMYMHQRNNQPQNPQQVADNILHMASSAYKGAGGHPAHMNPMMNKYPGMGHNQSPNMMQHSPNMMQNSPNMMQHSPNMMQNSPKGVMMWQGNRFVYPNAMAPQSRTSPISPMQVRSPASVHSNHSMPSTSPGPVRSPAMVTERSPAASNPSPGMIGMRSPTGLQQIRSPGNQSQPMRSPVHNMQPSPSPYGPPGGHQSPAVVAAQAATTMQSPNHPGAGHFSPHNPSMSSSSGHSSPSSLSSCSQSQQAMNRPQSLSTYHDLDANSTSTSGSLCNNLASGHNAQSSGQSSSNPLQSLQKLVMLPESQVVDPKSVVNDACLPSATGEQPKNFDGLDSAVKTESGVPVNEDNSQQQCTDGKHCGSDVESQETSFEKGAELYDTDKSVKKEEEVNDVEVKSESNLSENCESNEMDTSCTNDNHDSDDERRTKSEVSVNDNKNLPTEPSVMNVNHVTEVTLENPAVKLEKKELVFPGKNGNNNSTSKTNVKSEISNGPLESEGKVLEKKSRSDSITKSSIENDTNHVETKVTSPVTRKKRLKSEKKQLADESSKNNGIKLENNCSPEKEINKKVDISVESDSKKKLANTRKKVNKNPAIENGEVDIEDSLTCTKVENADITVSQSETGDIWKLEEMNVKVDKVKSDSDRGTDKDKIEQNASPNTKTSDETKNSPKRSDNIRTRTQSTGDGGGNGKVEEEKATRNLRGASPRRNKQEKSNGTLSQKGSTEVDNNGFSPTKNVGGTTVSKSNAGKSSNSTTIPSPNKINSSSKSPIKIEGKMESEHKNPHSPVSEEIKVVAGKVERKISSSPVNDEKGKKVVATKPAIIAADSKKDKPSKGSIPPPNKDPREQDVPVPPVKRRRKDKSPEKSVAKVSSQAAKDSCILDDAPKVNGPILPPHDSKDKESDEKEVNISEGKCTETLDKSSKKSTVNKQQQKKENKEKDGENAEKPQTPSQGRPVRKRKTPFSHRSDRQSDEVVTVIEVEESKSDFVVPKSKKRKYTPRKNGPKAAKIILEPVEKIKEVDIKTDKKTSTTGSKPEPVADCKDNKKVGQSAEAGTDKTTPGLSKDSKELTPVLDRVDASGHEGSTKNDKHESCRTPKKTIQAADTAKTETPESECKSKCESTPVRAETSVVKGEEKQSAGEGQPAAPSDPTMQTPPKRKRGRPVGSKTKFRRAKGRKNNDVYDFKDMEDNEVKMLKLNKTMDSVGGNIKKMTPKKSCRGPVIRIQGPLQNPTSCTVVNAPEGDSEKTSKKHKNKSTPDARGVHGEKHSSVPSMASLPMNNDIPWTCALCGKGSNYKMMGDLFGPYFPEGFNPSASASSTSTSKGDSEEKKKRKRKSGESFDGQTKDLKRRKSKDSVDGSAKDLQEPLPEEIWVHEDCIVWSHGVYIVGNKLHGLEEAVTVAKQTKCTACKTNGATLGCFSKGCNQKYHFLCAVEKECLLDEGNFSLNCPKHKDKKVKMLGSSSTSTT